LGRGTSAVRPGEVPAYLSQRKAELAAEKDLLRQRAEELSRPDPRRRGPWGGGNLTIISYYGLFFCCIFFLLFVLPSQCTSAQRTVMIVCSVAVFFSYVL